jgi:Flp pilus assembly protein TadB
MGRNKYGAEGATMTRTANGHDTSEQTTAELVKTASEQISRLVRDELRLAQAELAQKGKHAGIGIGMFGAGGLIALYGVAALVTAVVLLLAYVVAPWLAATIVGVVLLLIAGILALVGRKQVQRATPVVPEDVVRNVKADVATVTDAVKQERGTR